MTPRHSLTLGHAVQNGSEDPLSERTATLTVVLRLARADAPIADDRE